MNLARLAACLAALAAWGATAQTNPVTSTVLFENVRVFDGKGISLSAPTNVLVRGNEIERISAGTIPVDLNTLTIDGDGRTLMPGLIDAHVHMLWESVSYETLISSDVGYLNLLAAKAAEKQLLRGFTSVRDAGGPPFALKRVIDEGRFIGPRIYPSGASISQTSGHSDFRPLTALPREPNSPLAYDERAGAVAIADGVDEVLRKTRENLMRGASQIKVMAGGGIASHYDPVDVTQYTEAELRAAVQAADAWGTYVMVHAFTPKAIRQSIDVGVKCIEHGFLLDDDTARLMARKGIWLVPQPFMDDEDRLPFPEGSVNRAKWLQVVKSIDTTYELARKHRIKTGFGTDSQFDTKLAARQGALLAKLTRWYEPAEVLRMATSVNGELLALSGLRNPYPGKLGVIEEGALADLLLVDGDPIANIRLIEDPAKNFLVIMKDGKIYKNIAGQ